MPAADSSAFGPESRLRELGIILPKAPAPLGAYVKASQAGSLLFVSGTLPLVNGMLAITGRLGENLDVRGGQEGARLAALNALAIVREQLGSLDRVRKLAKLNAYLTTTADFSEHAAVADGASDLFFQLFGADKGHARMVSGVQSLPKGSPVVIETIFEIE